THYIKSYQLANIILNKNFSLGSLKASLNFQVNNLWNIEYQVVQASYMPLRNYRIGISFHFNKPNKD
ncbi:MAG TPA: hypothetical protein VF691_11910, partial [Cytophagaceae bacterium]